MKKSIVEEGLPVVSIIIPVKNEADNLKKCLASIRELDYPEEKLEIIIADALSEDETVVVAESYGAIVVSNRKQTVAPGRNAGFKAAHGEIIAFTDADCVVDKNWLQNSLKYFSDPQIAGVGGPNLTPKEEADFGKAVSYVFGQWLFAAGSIHARNLDSYRETKSLPGCNVIYRREVLDLVMPQDETLLTCDDTEMNKRILDLGYLLLYTPDVYVWHYRRPTLKKLWRQIYRYSIGRVQLRKRHRDTLNIVHVLVGLSLPLYLGLLLISSKLGIRMFALINLSIIVFLFVCSIYTYFKTKSWRQALFVPVVIVVVDIAWSLGFLREVFFPMHKVVGK